MDCLLFTRHDEDVPVLVPVVCAVSGRAVADGEARGLVRDQLEENRFILFRSRKTGFCKDSACQTRGKMMAGGRRKRRREVVSPHLFL